MPPAPPQPQPPNPEPTLTEQPQPHHRQNLRNQKWCRVGTTNPPNSAQSGRHIRPDSGLAKPTRRPPTPYPLPRVGFTRGGGFARTCTASSRDAPSPPHLPSAPSMYCISVPALLLFSTAEVVCFPFALFLCLFLVSFFLCKRVTILNESTPPLACSLKS